MPSSNFSVSLSGLQQLGSRLTDTANAVSSGAVFPGAAGAEDYEELTSAVDDFEGDWENAVVRLQDKTGGLGQKVSGIGQMMTDHDAQLAESLRPPEGG